MTNSQTIQPRNLSVADACTYVGFSRSTFYDLQKQGKAPEGFKVGKRRLIPVAALDAWMAELEGTKAVH